MKIEISLGEAYDRLSILEVKLGFIKDVNQLEALNLQKRQLCSEICDKERINEEELSNKPLLKKLYLINRRAWVLTDENIRAIESKDAGRVFKLIGLIFNLNKRRVVIKNKISASDDPRTTDYSSTCFPNYDSS